MPNASARPTNRLSPSRGANASRVPSRRPAAWVASHSCAKSSGVGSGTRVKRSTSGSESMAPKAPRWASLSSSRRTDAIDEGGGVPAMQDEKAERFRALHAGDTFIIPNPCDVGSARVLEALGFRALATTSSGFAFTLGRRDGGATLEDVEAHVRALSEASSLPVSVDLENGYAPDPGDARWATDH